MAIDIIRAPWEVPQEHEKSESVTITSIKQDEITAITNKMRYPAFETLIRVIASSSSEPRSEAIMGGLVSAFSQFDSPQLNGFKVNVLKDPKKLAVDYTFRFFGSRITSNILNSVELASIFHLPEQNAIPNSQVERQLTKQVDGPAKLATEGVLLGTNEFRGNKKPIYLDDDNRRRHMYVIGQTGMGKSVFLENIAFQDMCDGRGFAFIDPHGDAVEALLQRVPEERIDDVIYFDPADIEHPVGMNMFEYTSEDQKDFIVQEGISMLQSLFDPQTKVSSALVVSICLEMPLYSLCLILLVLPLSIFLSVSLTPNSSNQSSNMLQIRQFTIIGPKNSRNHKNPATRAK